MMNQRLVGHVVFIAGFMLMLTQYWEFAWRLYSEGYLADPLFGHFGLHHGYYGLITLFGAYMFLTKDDYLALVEWLWR